MTQNIQDEDAERPYDARTDPDSDPDNLNPRQGAQASAEASTTDPGQDPDSDPDLLNPRQGAEAGEDGA